MTTPPPQQARRRRWDPLSWLGSHELGMLIVLLLAVAGAWAFVELADEVVEEDTMALDRRLLLSLRHADDPADPLGPAWVEELGRDLTALGGIGVLGLLTLGTAGYLFLSGQRRTMMFVLAAVVGGLLLGTVMKHLFDRPRPDLVVHHSNVYTASFPSGHSMMSAVTYLTLGALLARIQPRKRLKAYLIIMAVLVTLLVGLSRIYVGVHWPTDVLAGWTAGATWALLCWSVAWWLQRSGMLPGEAR